jgi:hypothetical protein
MIVLSVVILHFSLFCFSSCGSYPVFFSVYSCVHYIDSYFVSSSFVVTVYTLFIVHH